MVQVHLDRRAIWNQCFVDGSVVGVPAIELFVPGYADFTTVVRLERQFFTKGELTGVTSLEPEVSIHTQWSDIDRGQIPIAGHDTATDISM